VLNFGMSTGLLVWILVAVDQVGWSGLLSIRAFLALVFVLAVSAPLGWLTGVAFWRIFYSERE